jgi:mono/diheme cytochrome c family protein
MNQLSSSDFILRGRFRAAVLVASCYLASLAFAAAADADASAAKASGPKIAQAAPATTTKESAKPKKEKRKLTGAELYAVNCNRCHPERYPTEWTPAQWKTIMLHMRVRANLPAAQAKTIVKYLQEEAGN